MVGLFEVKSFVGYTSHHGEIYVAHFLLMTILKESLPKINKLPYDLVVNGTITVKVKTTKLRPVSSHSMNIQTEAYAPEVCLKIFILRFLSLGPCIGVICGNPCKCGILPLASVPSHLRTRHTRCLVGVQGVFFIPRAAKPACSCEEPHQDLAPAFVWHKTKNAQPKRWSFLRHGGCKALIEKLKNWGCATTLQKSSCRTAKSANSACS